MNVKWWFLSTFHGWMAAYWQHQIDVAQQERDWQALSHAIERRDHHEDALIFQQAGKV